MSKSDTDRRLDALIAKVQSGELTMEQARAETQKIALGLVMDTGSPVGTPDNTPTTQLAIAGLMRLQGLPKAQAERFVLLDGVEAYNGVVEQERMFRAEQARERLERETQETPEERLQLAAAIQEQLEAQEVLLEKAKLLLSVDGGFNPDALEELALEDPMSLIEAAGLSREAYDAARAAEAAETNPEQLPASGKEIRQMLTGSKDFLFPAVEETSEVAS